MVKLSDGIGRPRRVAEPVEGAGVPPLQGARHALAEESRPERAQAVGVELKDAGGLALNEVDEAVT